MVELDNPADPSPPDSFTDPKFFRAPSALWPEWFQAEQVAAAGEFDSTPPPRRQDEMWRFSNLKIADLASWVSAGSPANPDALIQRSKLLLPDSYRLVFGNDELIHAPTQALPDGVIVKSLPTAAREDGDLFRSYFMRQPVELGSHRFAALHRGQLRGGVLIYVPAGVKVERPVEIFHWVTGENASVFPHTLVVCGEQSELTVIDHFLSGDGKPAFACGVNDLHLERGAHLHYAALQQWSNTTNAFHLNSTIVGRDASCTALNVNFGGSLIRGESLSRLDSEGARSVMLSLNPLDGARQIDQRTLQQHAAPNTSSDLLYHNSLDGTSRAIFSGLIQVAEGAHRTDAYQKVRNLLLSEEAEANSMPGLEILADDVRCTHGATSGQLSEDEIFYFQARGIPRDKAQRLILFGFFNDLLQRFEKPAVQEALALRLTARLALDA